MSRRTDALLDQWNRVPPNRNHQYYPPPNQIITHNSTPPAVSTPTTPAQYVSNRLAYKQQPQQQQNATDDSTFWIVTSIATVTAIGVAIYMISRDQKSVEDKGSVVAASGHRGVSNGGTASGSAAIISGEDISKTTSTPPPSPHRPMGNDVQAESLRLALLERDRVVKSTVTRTIELEQKQIADKSALEKLQTELAAVKQKEVLRAHAELIKQQQQQNLATQQQKASSSSRVSGGSSSSGSSSISSSSSSSSSSGRPRESTREYEERKAKEKAREREKVEKDEKDRERDRDRDREQERDRDRDRDVDKSSRREAKHVSDAIRESRIESAQRNPSDPSNNAYNEMDTEGRHSSVRVPMPTIMKQGESPLPQSSSSAPSTIPSHGPSVRSSSAHPSAHPSTHQSAQPPHQPPPSSSSSLPQSTQSPYTTHALHTPQNSMNAMMIHQHQPSSSPSASIWNNSMNSSPESLSSLIEHAHHASSSPATPAAPGNMNMYTTTTTPSQSQSRPSPPPSQMTSNPHLSMTVTRPTPPMTSLPYSQVPEGAITSRPEPHPTLYAFPSPPAPTTNNAQPFQ